MAIQSPFLFHFFDKGINCVCDVFDVKTCSVICRISSFSTEQFSDWLNTTLFCFALSFDNECCCTHAENQAITTLVKWQCRIFNDITGRRCSRGCKSTTNPFPEFVSRNIISGQDNNSIDTIVCKPIFSYLESTSSRSTCKINRGRRTTDTCVLSEL